MSRLTADVVETFWRDLDDSAQCAVLRQLDVVPVNSTLNFTQKRLGLLKVAEQRKLTKFRAELKGASRSCGWRGAGRRGPKSGAPLEVQRACVALCASQGFLLKDKDMWHPATLAAHADIHTDYVVLAAIKSGWLKRFHFNNGGMEFLFVVVTAAGHAALEQSS